MSAVRVAITRRLPQPAEQLLREAGFAVDIYDHDDPPPRAALLEQVRGAAGIVAMLSERIDAELLDAAGAQLRVVANYAVGFDNVDLAACSERGVRVTNTPGVLTEATADIAWALILAAARRVVEGDRLVRAGQWQGWAPMQLLGLELSGATLGIIGAGRIGSAVARRGVGFGMKIRYLGRSRKRDFEAETGATPATLDELLAEADVLSLHIPMAPAHRHMLGAAQFARMKSSAILINTARGPILDEAALVTALKNGQLAAAGFDVYEHEPRLSPGLAELDNVVLLPHLGSATTATRSKMAEMVARNVIAVLGGEEPPNPLN